MKISVLAFASASDIVGRDPLFIDLDADADLDDLRRELLESHPHLEPLWDRLAIAIDGELVGGPSSQRRLHEGAEIALLPPVSGGSQAARLCEKEIDSRSVATSIASPSRGAVLIFEGRVRDHQRGHDEDREVVAITYSAYPALAERALERLIGELEASSDNLGVAISHRIGEVAAGECSVVIAVASPHREAAYAASRAALERLKSEVPIWKREHFRDGESVWREEEPLRSAADSARTTDLRAR